MFNDTKYLQDTQAIQGTKQAAVDIGLRKGLPWETIATAVNVPVSAVRAYSLRKNPNYGIATQKAQQSAATTTPTGGGFAVDAGGGGGGGFDAAAAQEAVDSLERGKLRGEIAGRGSEVDSLYGSIFGDLDNLLRSRDSELEGQYGDQLKKASDTYTAALPEIENSYAAIGAADSTDKSDASRKADTGFKETTSTIKKNKETDKAKLGQYGNEQRAKLSVDKENAQRNVGRANETTDVDSLRSMRNELETNIGNAKVTRATLGTDQGARGAISNLTQDSGRFDAAVSALDSIIKSSMSGAVKDAAVKAVTDSAGLSDEEKKKVQQTYGNVYAEQAAL